MTHAKFDCPRDGEPLVLTTEGKGTARCPSCGGMFVPRSSAGNEIGETAPTPVSSNDDRAARCPNDHAIMTRALVELPSTGSSIHLDRCSSCYGVWFDAGEWNALATEHLLDHIDEFWTAEWRTAQRHDREQRDADARAREAFGGDLHAQLTALAAALRHHPRRSQALAFLREKSE